MLPVISEPRQELSKYAPKMLTVSIDPDKIGDVIGKGGKVIQEIQAEFDVKINIEEDGRVFISGVDVEYRRDRHPDLHPQARAGIPCPGCQKSVPNESCRLLPLQKRRTGARP